MSRSARRVQWSREELAVLAFWYPQGGPQAVCERLPYRTPRSIYRQAQKMKLPLPVAVWQEVRARRVAQLAAGNELRSQKAAAARAALPPKTVRERVSDYGHSMRVIAQFKSTFEQALSESRPFTAEERIRVSGAITAFSDALDAMRRVETMP